MYPKCTDLQGVPRRQAYRKWPAVPQAELLRRFRLLRFGRTCDSARPRALMPYRVVAELTGYSLSRVAEVLRAGQEAQGGQAGRPEQAESQGVGDQIVDR